jgi:hypothetical protein
MKRLPGELPAWMTTGRLVSVGHALGLCTLLVSWVALQVAQVPSFTAADLHASPLRIAGPIVLGAIATMTAAAGTSVAVGRARSSMAALLASVIGTSAAFVVSRWAVTVYVYGNARDWTDHDPLGVEMVPELVVGLVVGCMVGALLGLALARPATWFLGASRRTLAASSGRALVGVGVWLIVPAATSCLFSAFAALMDRSPRPLFHLVSVAMPCLAFVWVFVGAALLVRRARWLERVRAGEDPRFRVREATESDQALPALDGTSGDAVLEEVLDADADPYRAARLAQPRARLDR